MASEHVHSTQRRRPVGDKKAVHKEVRTDVQPVHKQDGRLHSQQHRACCVTFILQAVSEAGFYKGQCHVEEDGGKDEHFRGAGVQDVVHGHTQGVVLAVLQRHEHFVHHVVPVKGLDDHTG